MTTEVKHGREPHFDATLTGGSFSCQITGYYTATPGLAAAGVEWVTWASDRPEKRRAELLALRTAFIEWFLKTYQELGATREQACSQLSFMVDRILNRRPEDDP